MSNKKNKKRKQQHKYLNDIQIDSTDPFVFLTVAKSKTDAEYFDKQRDKYGFDERECLNFDYTFITWLYSHFKWMLEHDAIEDPVQQIKVKILEKIPKEELDCQDGEKHSRRFFKSTKQKMPLEKALEKAVEYMEEYLYAYNSMEPKEVAKAKEYAQAAIKIVTAVFPYLSGK